MNCDSCFSFNYLKQALVNHVDFTNDDVMPNNINLSVILFPFIVIPNSLHGNLLFLLIQIS